MEKILVRLGKAALGAALAASIAATGASAQTIAENNEAMFQQMRDMRGVSDAELRRIRKIFSASPWMGQGNPAVTRHPMSPEEAAKRIGGSVKQVQRGYRNPQFERICGEPFMAPLYDPQTQRPQDATV